MNIIHTLTNDKEKFLSIQTLSPELGATKRETMKYLSFCLNHHDLPDLVIVIFVLKSHIRCHPLHLSYVFLQVLTATKPTICEAGS